MSSTAFTWTIADKVPVPSTRPSPSALTTVRETVEHDWDLTTEGGRLALATIAQYESQLSGNASQGRALSAGLLVLSDLEARNAYWASVLGHSEPSVARGSTAYDEDRRLALETWSRTVKELERADSETKIDSNAFHILRASLVSQAKEYSVQPARGTNSCCDANSVACCSNWRPRRLSIKVRLAVNLSTSWKACSVTRRLSRTKPFKSPPSYLCRHW